MPAPRTCECMTCPKCRAREWARERYRLQTYGQWNPNGDLDAVRRHLVALQTEGVGLEAVVKASGVSRARIDVIRRGKAKRVGRDIAAALLAVTPEDAGRLPAFRVTRRLRALSALGYTTRDLAARLNASQNVVSAHLVGNRAWVHRSTVEAACELYETLCMTPGPNATSRRIAAQKGWAPPLAWEEGSIDDADARPHVAHRDDYHRPRDFIDPVVVERVLAGDTTVDTSKAEKTEIFRRWHASGRSLGELEALTGWRAHTYIRLSEEQAVA